MLPKSGKDRFLVFVDKSNASIKDLRERFKRNEYSTKTSGFVSCFHSFHYPSLCLSSVQYFAIRIN